ncbi:MAG: hypothetical protein HGA47_04455, partial [Zoogloea sp.]|nr:hypothetical protein [Zoogloea sp.]
MLERKPWILHSISLLILLAIGWMRLFSIGGGEIEDPFHQGEYFATFMSFFSGSVDYGGQEPLTIHGALDLLPAWLGARLYGLERNFLATELFYAAAGLLAALLLYGIAVLLADRGIRYRPLLLLVVASVAVKLVGHRDLLLLLAVFLYFLRERNLSPTAGQFVEAALGVALAASLFWSFDRGLAGLAALGGACLLQLFLHRRFMLALPVALLSVVGLGLLSPVFSFSGYLENVGFLLQTSAQWRYGLTPDVLVRSCVLAVPNLMAAYFVLRGLHKPWWRDRSFPDVVLLVLLIAFLYRIATNRSDAEHMVMGLWAPVLALANSSARD